MENQKLLQDFLCGGFSPTSSALNHHNSSSLATTSTPPPTFTMKRKSTPSPPRESFSKKPNVHSSSSHHHSGFKILPLPITYPLPSSSSTLRHTLSEPFNSTAPNARFSSIDSASGPLLTALSPQTTETDTFPAKPSSPANPLSTPLHRSFSDPFAVASRIEPQSPSSKNIKKIKEFIREMNQLCHELMQEEEAQHCECDDHNNPNETEINGSGNQETVSVEKCGNRVAIHFKCPCGKAHRILQAGKNCYYNLI